MSAAARRCRRRPRTWTRVFAPCVFFLVVFVAAGEARGQSRGSILVQSTTSAENSGLYDFILPRFRAESGWSVRVVAVGSGQALRNARDGNADLVIVHDPAAEEEFVSAGFGVARHPFMYNDYVLVGPGRDPAAVRDAASAADAFGRIAAAGVTFISRGDDSGTHRRELGLWGLDVGGEWYRESGSGMGATLNLAVALDGYTLSDRATWAAFANKGGLEILYEERGGGGGGDLFNQYSVIRVSPELHPHVEGGGAAEFVGWLLSAGGREAIEAFRVGGEQVFFANSEE